MDLFEHLRRASVISLAGKCAVAPLLIAVLGLAGREAPAAEAARAGQAEAAEEGGIVSRAPARLTSFDWAWSGGSRRSDDSTGAVENPDTDCESLEPFYGCIIDSIVVSGNTRTKSIAILREMASKQGAVLEKRLVRRDAAYLRGLGFFADLRMMAERVEPRRCRLHVLVVERPALFMRVPYPVVNYDFQRGLSYGAAWKIKNFRGLGESFGISGLMRKDQEETAQLFWNSSWFLGRRTPFWFDANAYRRVNAPEDPDEEYLKEQVSTGAGFGLPLTKNLLRQLWLKMDLSLERRRSRLVLPDGSGSHVSRLCFQNYIAPGAELEYDSRDDHRAAFNGMLHRIGVRRYSCISGPEQHYIFYRFSDYFYIPTGTYRSFVVGVDGDIREGDTPTFYEMKLGGVRDVRGFRDDELRGTVKLIATLQYRAQLMGAHVFRIPKIGEFDLTLNWVAFIDTGALMDDILDAGRETYFTTGGLGVEIISPFRDLLRLEMATDGTYSPAFYMTAGTDF